MKIIFDLPDMMAYATKMKLNDSTEINKAYTKVGIFLHKSNIKFKEVFLTSPAHTVEDVVNECGCLPRQVVKSLLYTNENNASILIVVKGNQKVDGHLLETLIGQKVRMATPKEVIKTTSYPVGSVSPFVMTNSTNIVFLADKSLLESDILYLGSGEKMILISMESIEFKKAFKGKFIKIV